MPLDVSGVVTGQIIQAAHVYQFYNLLTGAMTDQAVSLKNQVSLGGSHGTGVVPLVVNGASGQTADLLQVKNFGGSTMFGVSAAGVVTIAGTTTATGNVGVGGAPAANLGINVVPTGLTGTSQAGVYSSPVFSSAATALGASFYSVPQTAAAAFTQTAMYGFYASVGAKGAGSSVTTQYGLYVEAMGLGGTSNYGIFVNAPSGGSTNNVGIWSTGDVVILNAGVATPASATGLNSIRLGNNRMIAFRNNANNGDLQIGVDNSDQFNLISNGSATWPTSGSATAGASGALPAQVRNYLVWVVNGTVCKIPTYNV